MARVETILTILISSPSDVKEERAVVEQVIREFNTTWASKLGVRLEPIMWETHATPGLGADAQAVINKNLPEDYDFFLGIMWHRYGTPTGRAGSGTIEEFTHAKDKYNHEGTKHRLMFYFKTSTPADLSAIDPSQLLQVNEFKAEIFDEGMVWEFKETTDFREVARLHLTRKIQEWIEENSDKKISDITAKPTDLDNNSLATDPLDDYGLIELSEMRDEHFSKTATVIELINRENSELGDFVASRGAEVQRINEAGSAVAERSFVKRQFDEVADKMMEFSENMTAHTLELRNSFEMGIKCQMGILFLTSEDEIDEKDIEENISTLDEIRLGISNARTAIEGMSNTTKSLPRITKKLNIAKNKAAESLDNLVSEFRSEYALVGEAILTLKNLIDRKSN